MTRPTDEKLERLLENLSYISQMYGQDIKYQARHIAAWAALREYVSARTLTEEEAQSVLNEIHGDSVWAMDSALEKLRLAASPRDTTR